MKMSCRLLAAVAVLLLASLTAGCGSGRYPVSGRVTYEDGTPVESGTVIGEADVDGKLVGVQGNIEPDGSFRWGAERAGDGAFPGNYRVLVMPRALGDSEKAAGMVPAVDGKYGNFQSSGITIEVKAGNNDLPITVSRPKPKAKGR
jgi:hypothetical protein